MNHDDKNEKKISQTPDDALNESSVDEAVSPAETADETPGVPDVSSDDIPKPAKPVIIEGSTIFTQTSSEEQTHKKKKPKWLIALVAVLICGIVGGGVFLGMSLLPEPPATEEGDKGKPVDMLITKPKSDITSVEVSAKGSNYTLIPYETKDDDGNKTTAYKIKGLDDVRQDDSKIAGLVEAALNLYSSKKMDAVWDEKSCGLDKPDTQIVMKTKSDGNKTIQFGKTAPDGSGRYCKTSDAKGIYLVSASVSSALEYTLNEMVRPLTFDPVTASSDTDPYFGQTGKLAKFDEITIGGTHVPAPITIKYKEDENTLIPIMITSPVKTYAADAAVGTMLELLTQGLSCESAYAVHPTKADMEKYNLVNPESVITYKVKDKTYTIKASKSDDEGMYACIVNDQPVIYKVAATSYTFPMYTLKELRPESLFLRKIQTVKSLTFTFGGKDHTFDISSTKVGTGDDEKTTYIITSNAAPIVTKNFQNLYSRIGLLTASDYLEKQSDAPRGEPDLKLTYKSNNDSEDQVLTFTKYNDRYYHFQNNGVGDELIDYKWVEQISSYVTDLLNGKDVPPAG